MGIHIVSKSWRAPLQLIDSWLPAPTSTCVKRHPAGPAMQRFLRAGWLGKTAKILSGAKAKNSEELGRTPNSNLVASPVRLIRPGRAARDGGRLVISGKLIDVCAELDRLAALERHSGTL